MGREVADLEGSKDLRSTGGERAAGVTADAGSSRKAGCTGMGGGDDRVMI